MPRLSEERLMPMARKTELKTVWLVKRKNLDSIADNPSDGMAANSEEREYDIYVGFVVIAPTREMAHIVIMNYIDPAWGVPNIRYHDYRVRTTWSEDIELFVFKTVGLSSLHSQVLLADFKAG